MTSWLEVTVWTGLGLASVTTLCLVVYLDLRLHALRQNGELPPTTPQLFGFGPAALGVGRTFNVKMLYSRQYREIDQHTRLFVPIVRVTLPLMPTLLAVTFFT